MAMWDFRAAWRWSWQAAPGLPECGLRGLFTMTLCRFFLCALLAAWALPAAYASPDRVRFLEGAGADSLTPEQLAEEVKGFLEPGAIDLSPVTAPPAIDTAQDKADVAHVRQANGHASAERWARALLDDKSVYDRFTVQVGVPADRRHVPRFVRLLNRVAEDALAVAGEAKKKFPRARPFQRFALTRLCGQAPLAKVDPAAATGTSYPSGHAVVSWAVALVMVEASPASAQSIIARAVDYGESRVVCGLHFPSDITAGHQVAALVVDKLLASPAFVHEFQCAKRELRAVAAGEKAEDLSACTGDVVTSAVPVAPEMSPPK